MVYIFAENLKKSHGDKIICNGISLNINEGDRVAIVAHNGMGKSTLLNILAGRDAIESGSLYINKNIKIGFLKQEPIFEENKTVFEEVFNSKSKIAEAVKKYELALQNIEDTENLGNAYDDMDKFNGWDFESKIQQVLDHLEIKDLNEKVSNLSGGQRKRLALAQILIDDPNFLILDEPTNHLDIEMIEWLEKYFISKSITLLLVTHDRYFLDRVCNRIVELSNGNIYEYKGNYEYFLEKKLERESIQNENYVKTQNFIRKESNWVNKMPQGRGTKSRGRKESFESISLVNNAQKKDLIQSNKKLTLESKITSFGSKVMTIYNLYKAFNDKKILEKFNFEFRTNERIGIVGKNGTGKTTFLNIIQGIENYDAGNIVVGKNVTFGYFSQKGMILDEDLSLIDTVKTYAQIITLANNKKVSASEFLEKFLFPKNIQRNKVSTLSGGERKRLSLLIVILKNPNFLILDEPTNDLDLSTQEILQEFLKSFAGCLVIVSHDRYFMDSLIDHIFYFEGNGKVIDFVGNFSDFRERKVVSAVSSNAVKIVTDLSVNIHEKYLKKLEREIKLLEIDKEKYSQKLNDTNLAYEKIVEISNTIDNISKLIDSKVDEWIKYTN